MGTHRFGVDRLVEEDVSNCQGASALHMWSRGKVLGEMGFNFLSLNQQFVLTCQSSVAFHQSKLFLCVPLVAFKV